MSYLVLARKYRPRSFEQLVGQEHVVQALANALQSQRLHHAYFFTGTRGVGKTTVSRILAKSVNCTGPDGAGGITAQPCGRCDACRDIDAGRFVDYVELDAASNRGVEEITQLLDQAVYKPVVGRFKVYMIDEVHMLSNHAFNAMLKTLEEPPEYLKFVLATTDPQKVPPTVLSRCLQFNLRPMAPATVQQHLARVLSEEGIEAEAGALRLLARAAHGSMRDALSLTDQAIAFGAGRLDEEGVRRMLGAVDRGHAVRILDALAAGDAAALVGAVDELRAAGLSASGLLEELAVMLQQMAVVQALPDAGDEDDPDTPTLARLAALFAPDETQFFYSVALHGREEISLAPDEYSGLVMVVLRMLAFKPAAAEGAPSRPSGGAAAAPRPAAAAPPAEPSRASVAALAANPPVKAAAPLRHAPAPEEPRQSAAGDTRASRALQTPPWEADASPPAPGPRSSTGLDPRRSTGLGPGPSPGRDAGQSTGAGSGSSTAADDTTEPGGSAAPAAAAECADRPLQTGDTPARALGDRWADIVAGLVQSGAVTALARELAMQSQLVAIDGGEGGPRVWRLRVERESLRSQAQRDKLQAALSGHLDEAVTIELEPGAATDSPALREAAERARRQADAEQLIHNDPLVQSLMQQYRTARIVPGSIKPTVR
jgi:DNA polymerase-3 subunit gamma/tau